MDNIQGASFISDLHTKLSIISRSPSCFTIISLCGVWRPWMNHLPPAWRSTFKFMFLKWQLACKFGIVKRNFPSISCLCWIPVTAGNEGLERHGLTVSRLIAVNVTPATAGNEGLERHGLNVSRLIAVNVTPATAGNEGLERHGLNVSRLIAVNVTPATAGNESLERHGLNVSRLIAVNVTPATAGNESLERHGLNVSRLIAVNVTPATAGNESLERHGLNESRLIAVNVTPVTAGNEGLERHGLNESRLIAVNVTWLALTRKRETLGEPVFGVLSFVFPLYFLLLNILYIKYFVLPYSIDVVSTPYYSFWCRDSLPTRLISSHGIVHSCS